MQLHLKFTGGDVTVPMAYQQLVQGMLYNALGEDPAYRAFLHETGYQAGDRAFRHFVFGRLRGRYERVSMGQGASEETAGLEPRPLRERGSAGLRFPEGFSLEVRSAQGRFIQLLMAGMLPGSVHRLGQNEVTVAEARLEDRRVTEAEIRIRMDSPVTVHSTNDDGSTFFPDPFDQEFSRLLAGNAARKWVSLYRTDPPGGLGFAPLDVTARDKVVTRYKGFYVTGWRGRYLLQGEPAVLDLLYQTGLGSRNAQGFGLFELC